MANKPERPHCTIPILADNIHLTYQHQVGSFGVASVGFRPNGRSMSSSPFFRRGGDEVHRQDLQGNSGTMDASKRTRGFQKPRPSKHAP